MIINKHQSIIPEHLTIWEENDKLKYRTSSKEVDSRFIEILRSNKLLLIDLIKNSGGNSLSIVPLAYNQKALWFIYQIKPDTSSYNVGISIKIHSSFEKDILERVLSKLIKKYSSLRSSIYRLNNGSETILCQVINENYEPKIKSIEVTSLKEEEIYSVINEENNTPFDLGNGPLFRTILFSSHNSDSYLLFSFHHIICDAISLQLFTSDFIEYYDTIKREELINKEEQEFSYSDFIFGQLNFLNSKKGEEQLDFWINNLKNVKHTLSLPTDFQTPQIQSFKGRTIHFNIENEIYNDIKELSQKITVTPNILLFTVFELVISEISGQESFCIGVPVGARTESIYNKIFGYLVNILPIPCNVVTNTSYKKLFEDNAKNVLNALDNQDIPFQIIVDEIAKNRNLSGTPIFQVLYNYMNKKALGPLINFLDFNKTKRQWGTLDITPIKLHDQEGQFNLTLELIDDDYELHCALKYNTDIFIDITAQKIIDKFQSTLKSTLISLRNNINETVKLNPSPKKEQNELILNITGTFTVEPIHTGLSFWLDKAKIIGAINFTGYNQVFPQLLDSTSSFNCRANQVNILLIRLEDYYSNQTDSESDKYSLFNDLMNALTIHVQTHRSNKLVVVFCPPSDEFLKNKSFIEYSRSFVDNIENLSKAYTNLITIKEDEFYEKYHLTDYYDSLGEHIGNIPYKNNFFAAAATLIARKLYTFLRIPFKVIVLDCDETLWRGVAGEDGPSGIKLGDQELALQEFLVKQFEAGILLCLCSKNNEEDVWNIFNMNNMPLRKEHIALSKINWEPKSKNIAELSNELNLGLDSIIFIDDNPLECEEVSSNLPSVLTIQKKNDKNSIEYLKNSWLFDQQIITEEDKKRTVMYKQEAERLLLKSSISTYSEFIKNLNIEIDIKKVEYNDIPRISQLTYRTNQFNFTTIRRSEEEINLLMIDPSYHLYLAQLKDRFGDYGVISVIFLKEENNGFAVDTFLLSCRAFNKGVEHSLISFIGKIMKQKDIKDLFISYKETKKNIVAKKFLLKNFENHIIGNNENEISFRISQEIASSFVFNPDDRIISEESSDLKNNHETANVNIVSRNTFYTNNIKYYTRLEDIILGMYGNNDNKKISHNETPSKIGFSRYDASLLKIWQEVLRNDTITINDNFFDAGGESILIPEIVKRLSIELNINIGIVDVFKYPTIRLLSEFISTKGQDINTNNEVISENILNNAQRIRDRFKSVRSNKE